MTGLVPVVLILLIAVGAPVAVAILIAGVMYLASPDVAVNMSIAPLRMVTSMNNFLLIAVPLFILTGEIMSVSGITERLVRWVEYLVGWLRAGLAQINVAMSMFFGGISGLAMADAAAIGSVLIPSMKRSGYPAAFSSAVTGASAVVGPVIPPSVPAIIYAVIAGTSIAGLFAAGIVPGIMLGIGFMVAVALWARGRGQGVAEKKPFSMDGFGRVTLDAIPALLTPIIILVGIFSGVFTATEASAIAVVYSLLVGVFYYRTFKLGDLLETCMRTIRLTGVVLFIFAVAAVLSWAIGAARVPARLVDFVTAFTTSPTLTLVLLALLLVAIGMILDPTAAMIILVPIIAPLGPALGIDPLHLGLVVVLTLSIGLITPPIGYVLFIVAEIGEVKVESIVRELWPFFVTAMLVAMLVVLIPPLTTWAPGAILGR
jgi:tripartite ATP-independent transporter DctM subunit